MGIIISMALMLLCLLVVLLILSLFWKLYHTEWKPEERALRRSAVLYLIAFAVLMLFLLELSVTMLLRQFAIVPERFPTPVATWATITNLALLSGGLTALLVGFALDPRWRLGPRRQE